MISKEDYDKLRKIMTNKLIQIPPEIKRYLPEVLSTEKLIIGFYEKEDYVVIAFYDDKENPTIKRIRKNGSDPYPGLIAPNALIKTAIKIDNHQNFLLEDTKVENLYTFSLGKNTTIIIHNHNQIISTRQYGVLDYIVKLAYIVTFGDEINTENFLEYVEDLISYSILMWRKSIAS